MRGEEGLGIRLRLELGLGIRLGRGRGLGHYNLYIILYEVVMKYISRDISCIIILLTNISNSVRVFRVRIGWFKMRDSVYLARDIPQICNVLRLWRIWLILN